MRNRVLTLLSGCLLFVFADSPDLVGQAPTLTLLSPPSTTAGADDGACHGPSSDRCQ